MAVVRRSASWRALALVCLVAVALLSSAGRAAGPREWYLNASGTNGRYQIFAFNDDGSPRFVQPVIASMSTLTNLAWPSALSVGGERWLYVSGFDGVGWRAIYRWTSSDGASFLARGPAFTASTLEPFGVGPAQVTYEPDAAEPFTMYYLVRGPAGPGATIAAATSHDGLTWTRRGVVVSAMLPQEAGGVTVSYVCRMQDGDYALFYSGYSADFSRAAALVATGPTALGPFGDKAVMMEGDEFNAPFSANPAETTGLVGGALVRPGIPHLIADGPYSEVVVPVRQDGSRVWLDRPLFFRHTAARLISMAALKVEPSYAQQQPDGSWRAIMTMYGPTPGVFAEYTAEASAPTLAGPWTLDGTGIRFSPWLNATLYSTENPTPLVADASCGN